MFPMFCSTQGEKETVAAIDNRPVKHRKKDKSMNKISQM
jgi:hypothetical protein